MESLDNFISEKLKLSKNKKITYADYADDWKIENAQEGDFVNCFMDVYYIFKCFNKNHQYGSFSEDTIIFSACYVDNHTQDITIGPKCGVGTLTSKYNNKLATEEEREKFLKALEKKGYKWDENKLEIVKI